MITYGNPKVSINGTEIKDGLEQFEVSADLDKPDVAEIRLTNEGSENSVKYKPGDEVAIKMGLGGEEPNTVFKGKILGINPVFDTHHPHSVTIRAINDLHKLARERKTRTYVKQTEKQIIEKIAQEHHLEVDFGKEPPTLMHEHVHQNNKSDLEFIRTRASRSGREVFVQDKKLYFRQPEKDKSPVAELTYQVEGKEGMEFFAPKMSAAHQVKKVTVRGWNPDKKEAIVGTAEAENSPLGSSGGSGSFGDSPDLHVDNVPVRTKEEADAVAKSILQERQMNFITGSAVIRGNPKVKPGTVVTIKCGDTRFNGKYYVLSVRHAYTDANLGDMGGGFAMGGFKTHFQFRRDAEGGGGKGGGDS